jgi:hypothetical protein
LRLTQNEAIGLTNIVRRLALFFSPSFIMRLPEQLRDAFFERVAEMTQCMAVKASEEDAVSIDPDGLR